MGRHNLFPQRSPHPSRVRFAVSRAAAITLVVAVIGWIALSILFAPPDPNQTLGTVQTTTGQPGPDPPAPGQGTAPEEPGSSGPASTEAGPATGDGVVVHVVGAVRSPGVYRLPGGARIVDAIEAAGGMSPGARPELLNLASPVSDGQQVLLPHKDDPPGFSPAAQPPSVGPGSGGTGTTSATPSGAVAGGARSAPGAPGAKIPINQADAETLMQLPGIGPALAGRIIDFREANGPFKSVEELEQVSGIGPVLMGKLRELVQAP